MPSVVVALGSVVVEVGCLVDCAVFVRRVGLPGALFVTLRADIGRRGGHRPDQCDAVVVFIEPHEDHSAGHHFIRVDVRNLKAQHFGIEAHRTFHIRTIQHDMAEFCDREGHFFGLPVLPYCRYVYRHS